MNNAAVRNDPGSGTSIPLFPLLLVSAAIVSLIGLTHRSAYGEVDCLQCHEGLTKKKVVHAAVQMGCSTCHSAIIAADVPHKKTNVITRGLSSEVPDLCYGCHDKKMFEGKDVHSPVMGGMCLSCHDPHSADSPKLLVSEVPALCFTCHDKSEFTRKNIHGPVAAGMCLSCHNHHASKHENLTLKPITALCTSCHTGAEIKNGVHIVSGMLSQGHPVSGKTDPKRPGKRFSCASCHDPHSSDFKRLMRYKNDEPFEICISCHPK